MRRLGGFNSADSACGCCSCTDCCGGVGEAPTDVEVEITFAAASGDTGCERCVDGYSGIFSLSNAATYISSYCDWTYNSLASGWTGGTAPGCGPASATDYGIPYYLPYALNMTYRVRCIDSTHYRVSLQVEQIFLYIVTTDNELDPPSCCQPGSILFSNCYIYNVWEFEADVAVADWDCHTPIDLPYVRKWCACGRGTLAIGGTCDPDWFACELGGGGVASITPV